MNKTLIIFVGCSFTPRAILLIEGGHLIDKHYQHSLWTGFVLRGHAPNVEDNDDVIIGFITQTGSLPESSAL